MKTYPISEVDEPDEEVSAHQEHVRLLACEAEEFSEGAKMKTLLAISSEVDRAKAKWPSWPTDPLHACAILGEEYGELQKAVLQQMYEPKKNPKGLGSVREEAIHTAAMCLRFLESLDAYDFYARSPQHKQHIPCAACDRGDFQLGHADNCPKKNS